MALVFVCLIVLAFLQLALPQVIKYLVDNVFKSDAARGVRVGRLEWVLVVVLLITVLRNALFYFQKASVTQVGEQTAFELREKLIRHLHTLSVDFYQRSNPGKISSRVMHDVQAIKEFIQDELANSMLNLLMLVVATGILLSMNLTLAVVTIAVMPFTVLVYYAFRKPISTYAREAKEQTADVSGDLVQQFDARGVATVKASATQLLEQEKLRLAMRKGMKAQLRQSKYYVLQKVAADVLVGIGNILLIAIGGYAVINGKMQVGSFLAFFMYVGILYPKLLELVGQAGKFTYTATSVERVAQILQIAPGVKEKSTAVPYEITQGRIEFQNVSFSYSQGTNGHILKDVSFAVEPKDHVLITGPSGSGKSTCVNLIARFHDPAAGRILIDGVDVRDFTLTSLRRQIGFVFQDCFLFNDTIMANIRYAWPGATDEAVVEASRRSFAHEFIEKLPDGYKTIVGEGGVQLSAGQKRRLMIARAILKNPKILILDEPLVSLDGEARRRTIEGLATLIGSRTVLTISHYQSEVPRVNKQMHVCDGKVTVRDLSGATLQPS
jgi:subfamily B ATP-binding cassette protein MsbA